MELIDVGVNLAHDSFDHDRDEVLARARAAGVGTMVVTGSCRESSHRARQLAHEHTDMLYATAGVHPHHAKDFDSEDRAWIRELAADPVVVRRGRVRTGFLPQFFSAR